MKALILLLLFLSCSPTPTHEMSKGECILGTGMTVWKLLRKEDETYLFVQYPQLEGSPVHTVTDLSTYKKVECPN